MKNKLLKPVLVLCLILAMAVGGLLAYITAEVDKFDNKFVIAGGEGKVSDLLDIELDETFTIEGEAVETKQGQAAEFLPGDEIVKAPVVTVTKNAIRDGVYVFVELKGDVTDVASLGFTMAKG